MNDLISKPPTRGIGLVILIFALSCFTAAIYNSTVAGFAACIFLIIYFIPALTAYQRYHHQRHAIFIVNLFLGWSFFGWVAAMVWSVSAKRVVQ